MIYLLTHALERSAERAPDAPAACCGGRTLSWEELARRSSRLAGVLREQGVRRGDRVAIHAAKGMVSPVAMYGIMKAGAAYVPLDPGAPPSRLRLILEDCGIRHVVTEPAGGDALAALAGSGVALRGVVGAEPRKDAGYDIVPWGDVERAPGLAGDPGTLELDLAYVLYTSGSTGVPKGVVHTHRSALCFAEIAAKTYGFGADDRLSNHAPLHFDLSTMDYFSAAVAGAATVVIPEVYTRIPASLSRLLEEQRPTVLYAVPLALTHLLVHGALDQRDLTSLRWVLFGGEPFPPRHLRALMRALPGARFSNVYGPTEVNGVTYWIVPPIPDARDGPVKEGRDGSIQEAGVGSVPDDGDAPIPDDPDEPVPIGRPYGNVETLVVGADDEPVTPGEPGELLVRTPTMMLGYWRRPELDRAVFWRRAGSGGHDYVFLRTGDLVRERADGALAFLGRRDRQIKTRGYRVELAEVEAALASHDGVEAVGAFPVPDGEGSQRIRACATLRPGARTTPEELVRHAAGALPRYALPESVEILDRLPRTSTGKIDRLALRDRALGSPGAEGVA